MSSVIALRVRCHGTGTKRIFSSTVCLVIDMGLSYTTLRLSLCGECRADPNKITCRSCDASSGYRLSFFTESVIKTFRTLTVVTPMSKSVTLSL